VCFLVGVIAFRVGVPAVVGEFGNSGIERLIAGLAGKVTSLRKEPAEFALPVGFCAALANEEFGEQTMDLPSLTNRRRQLRDSSHKFYLIIYPPENMVFFGVQFLAPLCIG